MAPRCTSGARAMSIPVHRRPYDFFISHAHRDGAIVRPLVDWLTAAGLTVWFDERAMPGGTLFGLGLHEQIKRCRGIVVIVSKAAVASGWVADECNVGRDEQNSTRKAFRLVPVVIDDSDVSEFLPGLTALKAVGGALDVELLHKILMSQYPTQSTPPRSSRDLYVSASWREQDSRSSRLVCQALTRNEGFRLIGDSPDQAGFGEDRVERIICSCGALVAVIPFRDGIAEARAGKGPYRYFLDEIALAESHGLPLMVFADPQIRREDGDDSGWLRLETHAEALPAGIRDALATLWDRWQAPRAAHKVFCAVDQKGIWSEHQSLLRDLVEQVTALPTWFGEELRGDHVDQRILDLIRDEALLVIADLSDNESAGFNVDVCVEAGMARGAGKRLEIMWRGARRKPPFMLGGLQMTPYREPTDLLALVHRIVRPYRRRVINAELEAR